MGNNRRLRGLAELVQDTASITSMVDKMSTLAKMRSPGGPADKPCALRYTVDDMLCVGGACLLVPPGLTTAINHPRCSESKIDLMVVTSLSRPSPSFFFFVLATDKLMCHWSLSTEGLPRECSVDGMMKCSFTAENKLESMELTYDVMALARQLQDYSLVDLSALPGDSLGPKHPGSSSQLPSFAEAFAFLADGSEPDLQGHDDDDDNDHSEPGAPSRKKPRTTTSRSSPPTGANSYASSATTKPTSAAVASSTRRAPPAAAAAAPALGLAFAAVDSAHAQAAPLAGPDLGRQSPWSAVMAPGAMGMPNPFMSAMFGGSPAPLLAMAGGALTGQC